LDSLPALELWATDANPAFLEKAKAGIYTPSSLKEVPAGLWSTFFEHLRKENRFSLSPSLKEGIVWRCHNLGRDEPPSKGFHLVFLRNNLLTYYEEGKQVVAFRRILSALRPGGVLIIGKKERLPSECGRLVPLTTCPFAFEKAE
jgi:chemotaxis methyl-accepting protein methylase